MPSVTEQLKQCRKRNSKLQEENVRMEHTVEIVFASHSRYKDAFDEALSVLVKRGYHAEVQRLRTMVEDR